jgi:hypothetical protein
MTVVHHFNCASEYSPFYAGCSSLVLPRWDYFLRFVVVAYEFSQMWVNACVLIFGCLHSCATLNLFRFG